MPRNDGTEAAELHESNVFEIQQLRKKLKLAKEQNTGLLEACEEARIFIEYAIYELKDGKSKLGDQFPRKEDGYIQMDRLAEAIRKATR